MKRYPSLAAGGSCAIALACSYVVASLTYLRLPADQKGGTILHEPARYLESLARDSSLLVANHLTLGIGALIGIAVVIAVWEWTRPLAGGWMSWLSALGVLGFAVTAVDNFQIAALDPMRASDFAGADAVGRIAIAATSSTVSIDPQMWLSFGLTGIWILSASWVVARQHLMPISHALLGGLAAASYLFIEIASVTNTPVLLMVSAGAGGLVVGPLWYGWLGVALRRADRAGNVASRSRDTTPPPVPARVVAAR
jgi:hypothetical protein